MENIEILEKIAASGFAGFLLLVLWAGWKGIWVWGPQLTEMRKERDEWKSLALSGRDTIQRSVNVASRVVGTVEP